jgi:hypothetical protein
MELIKNSVSIAIQKEFSWIGPKLREAVPLETLHSKDGFYVFGFSIFVKDKYTNLKAFAFDFIERPDFRSYF